MLPLYCFVLTVGISVTNGIESHPEYFVGRELELLCPQFPEANPKEVTYSISKQRNSHSLATLVLKAGPSPALVSEKAFGIQIRARVTFEPPVFRLRRLNVNDSGTYKCRSTTTKKTKYNEIVVDVKVTEVPGPVRISMNPDDLSLDCKSDCIPNCTFKWFLNGKLLSSGPKLYLKNFTKNEALNSSYRCTAENLRGSASGYLGIPRTQESKETDSAIRQPGSYIDWGFGGSCLLMIIIAIAIMFQRKKKLPTCTCLKMAA